MKGIAEKRRCRRRPKTLRLCQFVKKVKKKFDDRGHLGNKAIWPRAYRGGEKMRENPGCPNYAFWEGDGGAATDAGQITEVPMMRAIHQAVPGNEVIKSNVHLTAV